MLGYFITGDPDPQHSIRLYKDSSFTTTTSAFSSGDTVYLEIYADIPGSTTITTLDITNYALSPPPSISIDGDDINAPNHYRCNFTLPTLTQDYWYNLKVTTVDTTFYKQIYIKPSGAIPIYACSHSNNYFKLEEYANLDIIGNLTARHGLKIDTTIPLSEINIIYDTRIFRDPKKTNPNAIPGAVSFNYTWKEVKD